MKRNLLAPTLLHNIYRFFRLLGCINDVSTSDLALPHQVVHHVQLAQSDDLVWGLDETTAEELNRLCRVGSVSDVGALDGDHSNNRLEDGCSKVRMGWKANGNNSTTRTDVLF